MGLVLWDLRRFSSLLADIYRHYLVNVGEVVRGQVLLSVLPVRISVSCYGEAYGFQSVFAVHPVDGGGELRPFIPFVNGVEEDVVGESGNDVGEDDSRFLELYSGTVNAVGQPDGGFGDFQGV